MSETTSKAIRAPQGVSENDLQRVRDHVPEEFLVLPRWVGWDGTPRADGRPSKVPISPLTGRGAKTNDPSTWASFDQAESFASSHSSIGGLGFVLTGGDHWALDLDHVLDPETREPHPVVRRFLDSIAPTYTEVSPSGDGLHLLFSGARPEDLRRTRAKDAFGENQGLEVSGGESARYLTMTGDVWEGRAELASSPTATIQSILAHFPRVTNLQPALGDTRDDDLERVRKALEVIPADDYYEWLFVGMALRDAFPGGAGRAEWDNWSRISEKYDESESSNKWASFGSRPGKTIAYIFWLADHYAPSWRDSMGGSRSLSPTQGATRGTQLAQRTPQQALSVTDVLDQWKKHGPLVHVPTGIPSFDKMADGGPVFGTRLYLLGAPDAGKTGLLVQILDQFMDQGIVVGLLAIDEEPGDVTQRLLQRRGWKRKDCERRRDQDLITMRADAGHLRIRLYDSDWTIEAAGEDLAAFAKEQRCPAALGIDSIQMARTQNEDDRATMHEAVTKRVAAIRSIATHHDLLVIATSEMNRSAYRTVEAAERANDLAAAKESGAIEYSARIAVALRSVKGESDVTEMRIVKNKHGPSHRQGENGILLRLDRPSQSFQEITDQASMPILNEANAKKAARDRESRQDAARLAQVIADSPGLQSKRCSELMAAATPGGMGAARHGRCRGMLGEALVEVPGKGMAKLLYLDGDAIPSQVLEEVPPDIRPHLQEQHPPEPVVAPGRSESLSVVPERSPDRVRVCAPATLKGGGSDTLGPDAEPVSTGTGPEPPPGSDRIRPGTAPANSEGGLIPLPAGDPGASVEQITVEQDLLEHARREPGLSKTALAERVGGNKKKALAAIAAASTRGALRIEREGSMHRVFPIHGPDQLVPDQTEEITPARATLSTTRGES